MYDLKPSDFTSTPMGSVTQNCESEIVAQNIMTIRSQLGDKWDLSWPEYKARRISHGQDFSMLEKSYFESVIKLIADPVGAIAFAPSWARDARKAIDKHAKA